MWVNRSGAEAYPYVHTTTVESSLKKGKAIHGGLAGKG
jgi:hypothetical protein